MFNRGKLWIIPNDDIVQSLFFEEVEIGNSHTKLLNDFLNKFKIDLNFSEEDYQEAPLLIAKMGNLVIKSDEDSKILLFYIPEKITDRQLEFFCNNEFDFNNKYSKIGGYSIEEYEILTKHGMIEIKNSIFRKNSTQKK